GGAGFGAAVARARAVVVVAAALGADAVWEDEHPADTRRKAPTATNSAAAAMLPRRLTNATPRAGSRLRLRAGGAKRAGPSTSPPTWPFGGSRRICSMLVRLRFSGATVRTLSRSCAAEEVPIRRARTRWVGFQEPARSLPAPAAVRRADAVPPSSLRLCRPRPHARPIGHSMRALAARS